MMLGDKLHTKTTKIHIFIHVLKVNINFQKNYQTQRYYIFIKILLRFFTRFKYLQIMRK